MQDDRRDEVVDYVVKKYGQEHVGQIVTFSTYGPKVALRDLGKVVSVSLPKLELMCQYIPTGKNKMTVKEVYETSYAFQNLVNKEPALKRILPCICTVEHLPRNISMHAAGVVLSRDCLNEVVPLTKGPNHHVLTQYSKDYIESVGLLKMDFLGLKNLTIISYYDNRVSNWAIGEFDENATYKVIDFLPDQNNSVNKGGTLRLGAYPCKIKENTQMFECYKSTEISERHRHRYEFNNEYRDILTSAGLVISGTSPDGYIVETVEIPQNDFYVGVQFHPEFKSRPNKAHPLFL